MSADRTHLRKWQEADAWEIAELHYVKRQSYAQIAKLFSERGHETTRNMISGFLHHLEKRYPAVYSHYSEQIAIRSGDSWRGNEPVKFVRWHRVGIHAQIARMSVDEMLKETAPNVLSVCNNQCRFVLGGHDGAVAFFMCGKPTRSGSSYCDEHHAYVRGLPLPAVPACTLNRARLVSLSEAIYGPGWQSAAARALGVTVRTVHAWKAGIYEPADCYIDDLVYLARAQLHVLQRRAQNSAKPGKEMLERITDLQRALKKNSC